MKRLMVLSITVCLLVSCGGDEEAIPSTHLSIDEYSLQLSNPAPNPGDQVDLIYPSNMYGYRADLIFDLEQQTSTGKWNLVAVLTTSTSPNEKPTVTPVSDKKIFFEPVMKFVTGSVPLLLPENMEGNYRIVDTLRAPDDPNGPVKTIAVNFDVTKL